jgi:uncharacterized protein YbbK (DUF523 family)
MKKILVSACLVGQRVRFDGKDAAPDGDTLGRWSREGRLVTICPEVAGGLGVPRPAAEIQRGTGADVLEARAEVRTREGRDVTEAFLLGARQALALAEQHGIRIAVLKARSPSCGKGRIHDGTFSRSHRDGDGVAAALLAKAGVAVFTDEELDDAAAHLAALERGEP